MSKRHKMAKVPAGFTSVNIIFLSCQEVCDALFYLFIRFCSKLYRQIVGIPMGTNCAPLVADLVLFCYEIDFTLSLSDNI